MNAVIPIGTSPTGCNGGHRKVAKIKGEKYYFTGVPCKNGHLEKRTTPNGRCIICTRERSRIKSAEWRKKHPCKTRKYQREIMREWRKKNPIANAKYMQRKRKLFREEMLAYERSLYAKNKKKMAEKNKKRQLNNPEMFATYARNRRARLKKSKDSHTKEDVFRLIKKQRGRCVYCCAEFKHRYDVDHKIPISKGGSNGVSNLQILCRTCNRKKNNKSHDDFLKQIKFEKALYARYK